MDWLGSIWEALTWERIIFTAITFVLSVGMTLLIAGVVIVKIPANYFSSHYVQDFLPNSSWLTRWGATVAKNVAGVVLVLAGIVMLVGPGQGILTILIGLIMLDIPGKRPLEARLINRPSVLGAVNRLRARYNKPPLVMD